MTRKKYKRKFFDPRYVATERRTDRKITAIVFGSLFLAFVIRQWVLGSVVIEGLSMYPTLNHNDRYLFHKWTYWNREPGRGDIIVIRDPMDGELEIKRVVGIPGDVVQVRDGFVRINKKPLSEPYLPDGMRTDSGESGLKITLVPKGRYYVLGDNRPVSRDSRTFGPVGRHDVLGKIFHPSEKLAVRDPGTA